MPTVPADASQRMHGLAYAMWHTLRRTRQAYVMLLETDGLWGRVRTRVAVKVLMARIAARCLPRILESVLPWHDPGRVADPPWIREWIALYERDEPEVVWPISPIRVKKKVGVCSS